jgi:glycosyltransferase involved in cell wall biosynthesis
MKIAYLLKKFPRLSETFVLTEMLGQERLGAQLHVWSRRPADPEPRHPQLAELRASIEVLPTSASHALRELYRRERADPGFFARACALLDEGERLGHARTAECLAEALWLSKRCSELGIEHVHTHFATDSAVTAWLLHRIGGPTYSITAHAKDIYRSTVSAAQLETLIGESSFTVTVCDANVEHLRRLLSPAALQRVRRLYNGIDLELFCDAGLPRAGAHVLGVGRLIEKKGFHVLVEAVALLRSRGLPVEATLIGDGDQRDALTRSIEALGLRDCVQLAGSLDQAEVRSRMQRATLLCLPCIVGTDGNRDALPTVLLEAQAVGLPCVSTPVSGVPEIFDQGRAGVLVPESDVASTARAIEELVRSPARREELRRAGRARAAQCFDLANNARQLAAWLRAAARKTEATCASPA